MALARQRIGGGNAALAVAVQRQRRFRDPGGSALTGQRGGVSSSGGVSAAVEVALAQQRSGSGNSSGSTTSTVARQPQTQQLARQWR